MFLVGLFSILIGLVNKKQVFLHYGSYVWSLWLYIFTTLGFSFQFFYPNTLSITSDTRMLSLALLTVTCINFVIYFLGMKKNTPKIVRVLRANQYLFLLLFLVYLYDYELLYAIPEILNHFFTINYFIIIYCFVVGAIKAFKDNKSNVQLFALSFSFVALGVLLYMGLESGFLPHSWFIINPIVIGVGIEVIILSFAMLFELKKLLQLNISLKLEQEYLKSKEILLLKKT